MSEQLAIWRPNSVWVQNGHQVEGCRLACGCTTAIPASHPRLATHNWPANMRCPMHGPRQPVTVVLYAQHQGVSLATHAPEAAA